MEIALKGVSGGGAVWSSRDFVNHYYLGNGRGVTVRETGHLSAIVSKYMAEVETRLKNQIARRARSERNGTFSGNPKEQHGVLTVESSFDFYLSDEFADPADIGIEVIDLGETISEKINRPLDNYLRARTGFPPHGHQRLGVQSGEPYSITDDWSGTLRAQIYLDPARSAYG